MSYIYINKNANHSNMPVLKQNASNTAQVPYEFSHFLCIVFGGKTSSEFCHFVYTITFSTYPFICTEAKKFRWKKSTELDL